MECLQILLLLLLHQTFYLFTGAVLEISSPSYHSALIGTDAFLSCNFTVENDLLDPKFLAIFWYFQDKELLRYDNKGIRQQPRISFSEQAARRGNASLSVQSVNISDGGFYKCLVIYSPERKETEIRLDVLVPPVLTIPSKTVIKNKENKLSCTATGFYPGDIDITWLRDREILQRSLLGKLQQNPDGTYNVNSTVVIPYTEENKNHTFSCRVHHKSLQEPLQEDFHLVYKDDIFFIVVFVTLGILLAVFILVAILWVKHRKKALQSFVVNDIKGPEKLIDGEEVTLYCTATNCTGDIKVTWLEQREGRVSEIPQSLSGDTEEKEDLLGSPYGITSNKEGHHGHTTALTFVPSVYKHKHATLICRFECGGKIKEKMYDCKTIYAKPQILKPLKPIISVSGEILYSLNLQKFYPKDIKIRWTCGTKKSQEMISSNNIVQKTHDATFNVCSEIRINGELLKDPSFLVSVTWEHESMDTPGNKQLSIRDPEFTWKPIVEEIQTPQLLHETPVTLQCNISEYFPDAVTVTWLRKDEGSQEFSVLSNSGSVSIPDIKSHRDPDNTYSCTTSLTVTPTLRTEQGVEYVCRVGHPKLELPIERSSRRLCVMAKPQVMEPIQITFADNSRVQFSLKLQRFHPKDIQISWTHGEKQYVANSSQRITENSDLTYDAVNEWSLPEYNFNNPEYKVSVKWTHVSMDDAEYRELSVRDFPWHPQVDDITIPRLEANKEVTLTCKISRYFPDALTVLWLKKGADSEVESALSAPGYKVSDIKSQKMADRTFTCEACLKFTPTQRSDQGAEIICRVGHPSLELPTERRTGPLEIHGCI